MWRWRGCANKSINLICNSSHDKYAVGGRRLTSLWLGPFKTYPNRCDQELWLQQSTVPSPYCMQQQLTRYVIHTYRLYWNNFFHADYYSNWILIRFREKGYSICPHLHRSNQCCRTPAYPSKVSKWDSVLIIRFERTRLCLGCLMYSLP